MTAYLPHTTVEGQRWDWLAWQYYGNPLAYELIISANPHVPITPTLPGGVELLIPIQEETETLAAEDLPPWKR